jgi:hypothetical protein
MTVGNMLEILVPFAASRAGIAINGAKRRLSPTSLGPENAPAPDWIKSHVFRASPRARLLRVPHRPSFNIFGVGVKGWGFPTFATIV